MKLRLLPALPPLLPPPLPLAAAAEWCISVLVDPEGVGIVAGLAMLATCGASGASGANALRLVFGVLECDSQAIMNSPPSTQCRSSTGASLEPYSTVSGTGLERGVDLELQLTPALCPPLQQLLLPATLFLLLAAEVE